MKNFKIKNTNRITPQIKFQSAHLYSGRLYGHHGGINASFCPSDKVISAAVPGSVFESIKLKMISKSFLKFD